MSVDIFDCSNIFPKKKNQVFYYQICIHTHYIIPFKKLANSLTQFSSPISRDKHDVCSLSAVTFQQFIIVHFNNNISITVHCFLQAIAKI